MLKQITVQGKVKNGSDEATFELVKNSKEDLNKAEIESQIKKIFGEKSEVIISKFQIKLDEQNL